MPQLQRVIGRISRITAISQERPTSACQHLRLVEPSGEGPTVTGTCRRCGDIQTYATAWLDIAPFTTDRRHYAQNREE